jgi:transcriptional regulator of acetoin/glycerol metabolism
MANDPVALLRRLGERRAQLQQDQEQLVEDIRAALVATEGDVSRVDACHLLGIDRTTLYRNYLSK